MLRINQNKNMYGSILLNSDNDEAWVKDYPYSNLHDLYYGPRIWVQWNIQVQVKMGQINLMD